MGYYPEVIAAPNSRPDNRLIESGCAVAHEPNVSVTEGNLLFGAGDTTLYGTGSLTAQDVHQFRIENIA